MSEDGKSKRVPAVVVGVDGSAGAREALRWALARGASAEVASTVRTRLDVRLHRWRRSKAAPTGAARSVPTPRSGVDLSDLHRAAEDLLGRALAEVGDEAEGVEIERQVVEGAAAEVLVQAATPGDLLVVGSRGHGGFAGLLLGSVSQQCCHHARCPVVVVHPPKPTAAGDESDPVAQAESPVTA